MSDGYPKLMYHPEQVAKVEDVKPSNVLSVRNARAEKHWAEAGFKPLPKNKADALAKADEPSKEN